MLKINITNSSKNEILEFFRKSLQEKGNIKVSQGQTEKKIFTIATPNPEQIMYAQNHGHFRDTLNRADVTIPDGVGVVWANRMLSSRSVKKHQDSVTKVISGIEFMEDLVDLASKESVAIALIGGTNSLAIKALDCLSEKHQGLLVTRKKSGNLGQSFAEDGPKIVVENDELRIKNENEKIYFHGLAKKITDQKVQMVFVGLGAPKQEYFIETLTHQLQNLRPKFPIVCMSVGGSFDEIAGDIPRAPQWVIALSLKWFWRLVLEPWRIKRQFALVQFVFLVLQERYSSK